MKKIKLEKTDWTIVGLFILLLVVLGFLLWNLLKNDDVVNEFEEEVLLADHLVAYTENGLIHLYDIELEELLDNVDLKDYTDQTEKTIEVEAVEVIEKEDYEEADNQSEEDVIEENVEMYEEYEVVSITIEKGQHVWGIQSDLTPDINVIHLLPKLQELNKDKSLHPVYPGDVRLFLKNPVSKVEDKHPEPKKDSELQEETKPELKKKTMTITVDDSRFVYYSDEKNKALYAYSNFSNDVYKITVSEEGRLQVDLHTTIKSNKQIDWLYADNSYVWLANDTHDFIEVFDVNSSELITSIQTKNKMSSWHVEGDTLHYAYENRMVSYDLKQEEINDALLGDVTLDVIKVGDYFFVLNSFGKKSENSILMKVKPRELDVIDLMELKSDQTAILSHGAEGNVYIGKIEKTTTLDGEIKEEPKVVSIDLNAETLKEEPMNWKLMFTQNMKGWNDHLYALENGELTIYKAGSVDPVKRFEVNGDFFALLP